MVLQDQGILYLVNYSLSDEIPRVLQQNAHHSLPKCPSLAKIPSALCLNAHFLPKCPGLGKIPRTVWHILPKWPILAKMPWSHVEMPFSRPNAFSSPKWFNNQNSLLGLKGKPWPIRLDAYGGEKFFGEKHEVRV